MDMLFLLLFILLSKCFPVQSNSYSDFEEFDDENEIVNEPNIIEPIITESSENIIEDLSLSDGDSDDVSIEDEQEEIEKPFAKPLNPHLKINQVPIHFKSNWDSYYIEMILLSGLAIYLVNFITGHSKNIKLANEWFAIHKDILESNFQLIGDENKHKEISNKESHSSQQVSEEEEPSVMTKDSENIYLLWCSGKQGCEGMLIEIKLIKRQDLFSLLLSYFKHDPDKLIISVYMNNEDMDSYMLALGQKKYIGMLSKDMKDLSLYCPEKKSGEKIGLPSNFQFLSEIGEATLSLVDSKVIATCNKYSENIDWIHFTDQYSGKKGPDETTQTVKPEDPKKCLRFCFSIPSNKWNNAEELATLRPLLLFVIYCIERVQRFKLSKEAKMKSLKNRQRVDETFYRQQHSQRQEAAQIRREERRKAEKERVLLEEDPLKQKRLEEKEHKREMKKKNPKFKQVKIRAM